MLFVPHDKCAIKVTEDLNINYFDHAEIFQNNLRGYIQLSAKRD